MNFVFLAIDEFRHSRSLAIHYVRYFLAIDELTV